MKNEVILIISSPMYHDPASEYPTRIKRLRFESDAALRLWLRSCPVEGTAGVTEVENISANAR